MDARNDSASETADREIVISRVFDAPRELVWNAMTDPKQVVQWWGPTGFTTTIHEMDVRPGGVWKHTMRGPDGTEYPNKSVFVEIVKPERIVYDHGGGTKGKPGVQFRSTWTFEAMGDKTKVTMRGVFPSAEARDDVVKHYNAIEGGKQTLGRLDEYLAKRSAGTEFVISRVFDAPRELVFKAWTNPKQMAQWWGPKGFTNPVCELDVRPGGAWHIVMRSPDGGEYPCGGVYREVVEPSRLVFTNIATDKDGNPILGGFTTVTFAEQGGKTKLTLETGAVALVDYAAGYLKGMEAGWTQSLDRLEVLVGRAA